MFSVRVEGTFSSAHNLREYKGKCEELHGHNWRVEAQIRSAKLDPIGMVVDFKDVKARLNGILEELDHKYLNDLEPFKKTNPTSENIARYLYGRLKKQYPDLASVTVWENATSAATYEE
ncbi:MAG TPA: 6-carboxytetrahydropterin synthase QueD [Candidatus Omnitrophota bacterium]|nr:6-carboxytetrahydropterin synthase QueD [Candidatus Omnitrophota bacterium]HQJ16132.1 6-carboxytetrahydropterin synthase QueD [Candidatus Omnitrophota bacterium]